VTVLAIDPGNRESAYALLDNDRRPVEAGKVDNELLRVRLPRLLNGYNTTEVAIEMVASYGMAVGAEVFETCVWIGRFLEACHQHWASPWPHRDPRLVYRRDVKLHHCGSVKAKDANITQALIDRFAANVPNRGKGTKAEPGWFHGFKADIWQAYALGVLVADMREAS
jgi:hypothetical protein